MIGIEFWVNPKHWNIVPKWNSDSRIYSISWLMFYVQWYWPD